MFCPVLIVVLNLLGFSQVDLGNRLTDMRSCR